ncbi:hypothetical protein FQA39_LY05000 [Lamprigera yunnana]|nr:hypothetical protein FQA39_LY05000 [Lamprigera yunnana]
MRAIIILPIVFILSNGVLINYSLDRLIFGMRSKFHHKCDTNGGNLTYSNLKGAVANLYNCVQVKIESLQILCNKDRAKSYDCYVNFLDKLEKCLEPQEKYLKDFMLNAHNLTYNKICKMDEETLLGLVSGPADVTCLRHSVVMFEQQMQQCLPKLKFVKNLYKHDDVITKVDLCHDIEILKSCISKKVEPYCQAHENISALYNMLLESYLDTCAVDLAPDDIQENLV